MFEKIVLRRSENGHALTVGEVAEAMLFYEKVHLLLDPGSLKSLVDSLGADEFVALLARKRLTALYSEEMLVARHDTIAGVAYHSLGALVLSGREGEAPRKGRTARMAIIFEKGGLSHHKAKKLADRISEHISINKLSGDLFVPGGIPKAADADLADAKYLTAAIRQVLLGLVGFESFAEKLQIALIPAPVGRYALKSNINFADGNARRRATDPELGDVTEGTLLVALVDAKADMLVASHYGGDFRTSSLSSDVVRIRHAELLRRSDISAAQLLNFKEIVLPAFPTIREVINSGERTFAEFEHLLDKSEKFRRAIHKIGPDETLVGGYIQEVTREGWTSKLPSRIARYVLAIATGHLSEIAGAALTAGDSFLLDKIAKGWRPNHFVDRTLKPFLNV